MSIAVKRAEARAIVSITNILRIPDQIQIAELADGRLPETESEIAVQAPLLVRMGVDDSIKAFDGLMYFL